MIGQELLKEGGERTGNIAGSLFRRCLERRIYREKYLGALHLVSHTQRVAAQRDEGDFFPRHGDRGAKGTWKTCA